MSRRLFNRKLHNPGQSQVQGRPFLAKRLRPGPEGSKEDPDLVFQAWISDLGFDDMEFLWSQLEMMYFQLLGLD